MMRLVVVLALGCAKKPAPLGPVHRADPGPTVLAVGSCSVEEAPQHHWDVIASEDPEAFLFIGDNVYADYGFDEDGEGERREGSPDDVRAAYDLLASHPEFQRFRAAIPILATWDDHDYGRNDGTARFEHKLASEEIFEDFWELPDDDPRRSRPGVYGVETIEGKGTIQVILLDTRFFRSPFGLPPDIPGYGPNPDPDATMLGEEQWAFLREALQHDADIRILATSIQLVADRHHFERWGHLPHERRRLFALLTETGAEGLIVVSGDRHRGAMYLLDDGSTPYPLFEITASGLNNQRPGPDQEEADSWRLGPLSRGDHYGLITVDWEEEELTLQLKDMQRTVLQEAIIGFDELEAGRKRSR